MKIVSCVSGILNEAIDNKHILDIEQIDNYHDLRKKSNFDFNYLNLSYVQSQLHSLRMILSSLKCVDPVILSLSHSSEIALFKVSLLKVIESFDALLELDKDTISVTDLACENGFTIDIYQTNHFFDGEERYSWIYESRVFGMDWMRTIIQYG